MKKTFNNIRTLAALLMAGAAFAACSTGDDILSDNQQPADPTATYNYTLTIQAGKSVDATRALTLDYPSDPASTLSASWTNGDVLKVQNNTKHEILTGSLVASNASGGTATFSGSLSGTSPIEPGDELLLFYHLDAIQDLGNFNSQNGLLTTAQDYDFAVATVTVKTVDAGEITINEAKATFVTNTTVMKIILTDGTNPINASQLTLSVTGSMTQDIWTFTIPNETYTTNGDGVLFLTLPCKDMLYDFVPTLASADHITFTATVGSDQYSRTIAGEYPFIAGVYYVVTLTMKKDVGADKGVDLGLFVGGASSGKKLLWAKMNVGATTEADPGEFFAWGDVKGRLSSRRSDQTAMDDYSFTWTSYKYSNGAVNKLTKYCYDNSYGNEGFTDGLTTINYDDDGATANWGNRWRIPTDDEINALVATKSDATNYSWEWKTDYDGVYHMNGWLITYKVNGNSIFLPAAGYRTNTYVKAVRDHGLYWSSKLHSTDPSFARVLHFEESIVEMFDYQRYNGLSIRPVREQ